MKKFAPRNGATRASGERGAGSKPRLGKVGRPQVGARKLCEEFAPRNGAIRLSGGRGANRAGDPVSLSPAPASRAAGPHCIK